jgi:hypothetical protein
MDMTQRPFKISSKYENLHHKLSQEWKNIHRYLSGKDFNNSGKVPFAIFSEAL